MLPGSGNCVVDYAERYPVVYDLCPRCEGQGQIQPTWNEFKLWVEHITRKDDPHRVCRMMKVKHDVWDRHQEIDCLYCELGFER